MKQKKQKLDIIFHVGGLPFDSETIKGRGLGGSETAGFYMAENLAARGHSVIMFTKKENPQLSTSGKVSYFYCGEVSERYPLGEMFHRAAGAPHDVCVIQRHGQAFLDKNINAKLKIWWLHDIAIIRAKDDRQFMNVDKVFTVSAWHKRQVHKTYNIPLDSIYATKNGIDYSLFGKVKKTPYEHREQRSLLFASRPERGLENLVKVGGIMENMPDYKLYVCSYKNVTAQMKPYYNDLYRRCDILQNVEVLGHLSKGTLNEKMSKCMAVVHPTTFEDTSNMLSLEANACGTPFIGFKTGALPETMLNAGAILLPLDEKENIDAKLFIANVRQVCENKDSWTPYNKAALEKKQAWEDIALDWESEIFNLISDKNSPTAYIKHMIQHSDIMPLLKTMSISEIEEVDPKFQNKYGFVFKKDYKEHYKRFYEYEKKRGVKYEAEDISSCNRFQTCRKLILAAYKKYGRGVSILDYGCAHGHYAMNLKKYLPQGAISKYIGIDISKENIKAAEKWRDASYPGENISFFESDYLNMPLEADNRFDILLLGEVLEHMPCPTSVVNALKKYVKKKDGVVIVTTPYGAWEAIGYDKHPDWCRAHIWHFEKRDIIELFNTQDDVNIITLPHPGDNDFGHYITIFKPNDKPVRLFQMSNKRYIQNPQETLSVCMIVKDEESSLRHCIEKIKDIADEIIIGVDKNTTDRTFDIIKKMIIEDGINIKYFTADSPLDIGFDEARNRTISYAIMDWILWIDGDESLEMGYNLKKYLKKNLYDGYSISQHHYAVEPAALYKTDYPVRIFRNRKGIKFFGMVHEHPETGINEGVGSIKILNDVHIMHTGYSTEKIRRERFMRNWPLMQKDHMKYPERLLGRFLYIRDLAHLNKYEYEKKRIISKQVIDRAVEVRDTFLEFIKEKNLRNAMNALEYYSESSMFLTRGFGVVTKIDISYLNKASKDGNSPLVVDAMFTHKTDLKALLNLIIDQKLLIYENKYF